MILNPIINERFNDCDTIPGCKKLHKFYVDSSIELTLKFILICCVFFFVLIFTVIRSSKENGVDQTKHHSQRNTKEQ